MLAGGLNIGAIFFPFAGPIAGFALSGDSKFVKYHALRALLQQIVKTVLVAIIVIASLSYSVYSLYQSGVFDGGINWDKIDWVTLLIKSAATWIAFGLWALFNTISSVRDGLAAFKGEPVVPRKWTERKAAQWAGLHGKG